jgi:hypothetical protein
MARGGPGLPRRFIWRGRQFEVEAVLATRRPLGPCTSGSGETMTVYFDRQARRGHSPKARWWLYTMEPAPGAPGQG